MGIMQRFLGNVTFGKVAVQNATLDSATANLLKLAAKNGVTAHVGGGKANATQLGYGLDRISVCATAADSVLLPAAVSGAIVVVFNSGAAAAQVFGKGTDTIDAVVTATGVVLTNAKASIYACLTDGAWVSLMGVKSA